MNRIQRWTLIGGLLLVFLAGLFPPTTFVRLRPSRDLYIGHGRTFLVWPNLAWTTVRFGEREHEGYFRIDYYRLGLEWVTITVLAGTVFLIARKRGATAG